MDSGSTIRWTEELSIGNPHIDEEHARIIELYNELTDILASQPYDNSKFAAILNGLFDYSFYHFRREERYMQLFEYPDLNAHKEQHKAYILHVSQMNARFFSANPPNPADILAFLGNWWSNHIQQTDQLYERYKHSNYPDLTIIWETL